ncbi:hypothetical protein [Candidatus Profftia tarda]|uniref:hypothetical protein n=1 Tax=Candidatus Profftia tarda TaxID=1177216 RepID=UPI003B968705
MVRTTLLEISDLTIKNTIEFLHNIKLQGHIARIAKNITKDMKDCLFLVNVGLSYLSISRNARTRFRREAQRIRLAQQIKVGLMGIIYVLDEPSIRTIPREIILRLLKILMHLCDLKNIVMVVEHGEDHTIIKLSN